ncbi:MAG: hypothetical protein P0S95_01180 [Rhabdochlamydiaceae bacterium]|nr:hypothetical protein [Candidatus Amphrikana amoebophyrae]
MSTGPLSYSERATSFFIPKDVLCSESLADADKVKFLVVGERGSPIIATQLQENRFGLFYRRKMEIRAHCILALAVIPVDLIYRIGFYSIRCISDIKLALFDKDVSDWFASAFVQVLNIASAALEIQRSTKYCLGLYVSVLKAVTGDPYRCKAEMDWLICEMSSANSRVVEREENESSDRHRTVREDEVNKGLWEKISRVFLGRHPSETPLTFMGFCHQKNDIIGAFLKSGRANYFGNDEVTAVKKFNELNPPTRIVLPKGVRGR